MTGTKTYRRAVLWTALVVLLIAAAVVGGRWWWTEYGPGSYLTMPATNGRPLAEVQAELNAMGLASSVEEEFSDDVAAGSITRSDPSGGEPVHKRAEVQLHVSKGVDMKTVPDVVGKNQDDARKALTDAGLALGAITDAYSEDVPQGPGHLAVCGLWFTAGTRQRHRCRAVEGPRAPHCTVAERDERRCREERHRGPWPRGDADGGVLRHGRRGPCYLAADQ